MPAKHATVTAILAVCALLSILYAWDKTHPVALVNVPGDRLQCVSYAPFREPGQSPYDPGLTISPARIDADLALLAKRFQCIRIYSVDKGLQEVPRLAAANGLKVLLGVWIGRDREANETQIKRALEIAKTYRSTIEAVIVGNEVLLRKDQPVTTMRSYIDRVESALPDVPVTYADVWEFWLLHRELKDEVDFITVHILPYWEDHPIPIEDAVDHVSDIYQHMVRQFKGKAIMIGETGWPGRGRRRQGAEPGLVNQAKFIREFAVRAELEKIRYNLIEAFDQPWKRTLEGTVGGSWGLYEQNDAQKFPFQGRVAEQPEWGYRAVAAWVLIFLGLLLCRRRTVGGAREVVTLLAISFTAGSVCLTAWQNMWIGSRTLTEWSVTGFYGVLLVLLILHLGSELVAWCANGKNPPAIPSISHLMQWIRRDHRSHEDTARLLAVLRFAFLFGAAFICLVLFFDPRYRDFPLALYAAPSIGFALWAWICERTYADIEEIILAVVVTVLGVLIAISEHLITASDGDWLWADGINPDALTWTLCCLLLAGSVLVPVVVELRARQSQYTQQKSHGRIIPVIQYQPGGADPSGNEPGETRTRDESQ
ncbi:MAG: hypothetical protein ACRESZ_05410 [Methylococcales bacterium]